MSVTFTIEANPTGSFSATCYEADRTFTAADYDGIAAVITEHKVGCEECAAYGLYSEAVMDVSADLDVNVSNLNAGVLLAALGVETDDDLSGGTSGEDFLGRVLLALAADHDDTGAPSVQTGNFIECGVRPGWWADRLGALHALASEAVRLGRDIHWC